MTSPEPARLSPRTDPRAGEILLAIARAAIADHFGIRLACDESTPWLSEPGATFVTLTEHGRLRGCIGSLEAYRPLLTDLRANARAAAFRDPRFAPLTAAELGDTRIEVSLLSATEPLEFTSEADAVSGLRPGVDGVILVWGSHRGTFLPQVWEQLPDPAEFLGHLKRKAGLSASFWDPQVRLWRYTVTKWKESKLPLAHPS